MPNQPAIEPHQDLVTRFVRGAAPALGLFVLFGAAARLAVLKLSNDDTFFHLRFGAEFLDGWSIQDPGSVTQFGTREWTPTQWATQILMTWMEGWGGTAAVAWLAGFGFLTFILVLYLTCRRQATPLVAAVVTAMAFLGASQGLSARPQVISYILVTVTVGAWLATAHDGRLRWWLVPMTWAWANLHGMWSVGIVIGLVAGIGIALDQRDVSRLKTLLVPGLSLIACALTPMGPGLLREVAVIGSRGKYFGEWGPTQFTDPAPLVLSALFALVLLVWFRTGPVDWLHGLLFLLAGACCLYSMRTVPVGAALVAPVAAAAIMRLLPGQDPARASRDRRVAWSGWAIAVVSVALIAPHTLKVGSELPTWADHELAALPEGAVILNDWNWGGYLMWQHPGLDFVISGYGDIYTNGELDRNIDLIRINPGWDKELAKLSPDAAILDSDSSLTYALVHCEGWRIVRSDDGVDLLKPPA